MLRVGDFSKLAHITVKTLRHYDELGLLRPVWIDRFSGYRYYTLEQLPRLNSILALKDLGFSLGQIGKLLDSQITPDELRRMFVQKQAELAEQVRSEQDRLARVDLRIRALELEGRLPVQDVTVKSIPALWVACLRTVAPGLPDLPGRASRMRAELDAWARANGLRDPGPWLTIFNHAEYREHQLDVEIGLVLDRRPNQPVSRRDGQKVHSGGVEVKQLPEVAAMACLLQAASAESLQAAYTTLFTWTEQQGYLRRSPLREVLLEDPAQKGAQFVEVQIPVESCQMVKQNLLVSLHRKEEDMEPKIVDLPNITLVGLPCVSNNEHQEIPHTWDVFNARCGEIQHVAEHSPAYGVCNMLPDAEPGVFEYTPSFAVNQAKDLPEGMVERLIPAGRYAVFVHIGLLEGLKNTYEYIYQIWLPQSGFQLTGGPDFELYNEEWRLGSPDSRFYIYIPIQAKN